MKGTSASQTKDTVTTDTCTSANVSTEEESVVVSNIISYNCHKEEAVTLAILSDPAILLENPPILCLQEPYLPSKDSPLQSKEWIAIAPTNCVTPKPRSLIYIPSSIPSEWWSPIQDFPTGDLVAIRWKAHPDHQTIIINAYCQPGTLDTLAQLHSFFSDHKEDQFILLGDFNSHHSMWEPWHRQAPSLPCRELLRLVEENNLGLASPPGLATFHSHQGNPSVLDLVWASQSILDNVIKCGPEEELGHGSDHTPVFVELQSPSIPSVPLAPRYAWAKTDWIKAEQQVEQSLQSSRHLLENLNTTEAVDASIQLLTDSITRSLHQNTPLARPFKDSKPWWKPHLSELAREMRSSRRIWKRSGSVDDGEWCRICRNRYKLAIRKAKRRWEDRQFKSINHQNVWRVKKDFTKAGPTVIPALRESEQHNTTDDMQAKCEILRQKFFPPPPQTPETCAVYPAPLESEEFSSEEVAEILTHLRIRKSPGPDTVPNSALVNFAGVLTGPLTTIYNAALKLGYHPLAWKKSTNVVLRKPSKKDYSLPNAYRPIALLPCLGKVFERLITGRLSGLLEAQGLLPEGHMGGRKTRGTETALLALTDFVRKRRAENKWVLGLFLDVQGAFNNVSKSALVHRLKTKRTPVKLVQWIESFLSNRSSSFKINSFTSTSFNIDTGIPQGSPISPLLYIIYNSDLLDSTSPDDISLGYIDDSSFVAAHQSIHGVQQLMQERIDRAVDWATSTGSVFDPGKTQLICFGPQPPVIPELTFYNTKITPSASVTYLGVILDRKLNFKAHVDRVAQKATGALQILSPLLTRAHPHFGRLLYKSSIVPIMDYASIVWAREKIETNKVEVLKKVQRKALLMISGAAGTTSTDSLEVELHVAPTEIRLGMANSRAVNRIKGMHMDHVLRRLGREDSGIEGTVAWLYGASFKGLEDWRGMWRDSKKGKRLKDIDNGGPTDKTFALDVNIPRDIITIMINLRSGHDKLNEYLHKIGKVDSPYCACGQDHESREHYLLMCTLHEEARKDLGIRTISQVLTNAKRLEEFVKRTKRFRLKEDNSAIE